MGKDESSYKQILKLIDVALKEDIRSGDLTSQACIGTEETISGRLIMKQGGRIAGLPFLEPLFQKVDPNIHVELLIDEGSEQIAGTVVGEVSGPARGVFSAERVALNLMRHASGIATITGEYVEQIEGIQCDILDTRKTLPGLRCLEKYAVKVGGGTNHRWGLDDRFIIKRNHIWFLARRNRRPIAEAVDRVRRFRDDLRIEVEVGSLDRVKEALDAKADIIRLDNMPIGMMRKSVALIKDRAYIEASSEEITLETIRAYAETGVSGISVGALTNSVQDVPISLRF